jgi:hypothetical protein
MAILITTLKERIFLVVLNYLFVFDTSDVYSTNKQVKDGTEWRKGEKKGCRPAFLWAKAQKKLLPINEAGKRWGIQKRYKIILVVFCFG